MTTLSRNNFWQNPHRMLLADAIGAAVSTFFLGIVLGKWNEYIGMPVDILNFLAGIASFFAVYSFYCYFFIRQNHNYYLRIIMICNIMYGLLSATLVVSFISQLTTLGILYFLFELIILSALIFMEYRTTKAN